MYWNSNFLATNDNISPPKKCVPVYTFSKTHRKYGLENIEFVTRCNSGHIKHSIILLVY